jgi:excinuclease ABC subunit B
VADGESSTQKAERIAAIEQAPVATEFKDSKSLDKEIKRIRKLMEKSAKNLEFIEAAGYRDQMRDLQKLEKQFE